MQPIKENIGVYIGIDWAEDEHSFAYRVTESKKVETGCFANSPEAIGEWIRHLRQRFPEGLIAIALEQSRGSLIYNLQTFDFVVVYPINPKSLARFREALYPNGPKDDPTDAELLLEMVYKHREGLRCWQPQEVDLRELQLLVEYRRNFVDQRTSLAQALRQILKDYYPQALQLVGKLDSMLAYRFLKRWPTLKGLKRASQVQLIDFYHKNHSRSEEIIRQRLALVAAAEPVTEDPAIVTSHALKARALVNQIKEFNASIDEFDRQIDKVYCKNPDRHLYEGLPGAGNVFKPRLAAFFGRDRNRYHSAEEIQRMTGVAPITKKSGRVRLVYHRYACPKFQKQTFHEFAASSIPRCAWAKALYQRLRKNGKGHHAAIRAISYKWIRILFQCWKAKTPYNEELYIQSLVKRGSPLVRFL